jgi:hypothetical protein
MIEMFVFLEFFKNKNTVNCCYDDLFILMKLKVNFRFFFKNKKGVGFIDTCRGYGISDTQPSGASRGPLGTSPR